MRITKPAIPKEEDLKQLSEGLKAYNISQIGEHSTQKLGSFVVTDSGEIMGGAYALINWGWLYIEWLWCHEDIRGQGYGSKLILGMEDYAKSQNINNLKLETTDFQALDFYIKQGFTPYGELNNFPIGHTTYYLKKELRVS